VGSPPEARIRRAGRWTYYVEVHHGMIQWGPNGSGWFVLGRRRAERKARRLLAAYVREMGRDRDVHIVTLGPYRQEYP